MIDTRYGVTHILITGPKEAPPLIISEIICPMLLYRLFPNRSRLLKAVRPMFTEDMDEITLDVIGLVFLHVKLDSG